MICMVVHFKWNSQSTTHCTLDFEQVFGTAASEESNHSGIFLLSILIVYVVNEATNTHIFAMVPVVPAIWLFL